MIPFYASVLLYCRLPHNILSCAPNQSIAGNQFYSCDCAVTQFCFVCFFRSFLIISVTVSEEGIAKAGKAIKEVEEKLLPQCTRRFKANFLIGKADYFIRRATRPGGDIGDQERELRIGNIHLVSEKCRKNERSCDTIHNTCSFCIQAKRVWSVPFLSKLHFPVDLVKLFKINLM